MNPPATPHPAPRKAEGTNTPRTDAYQREFESGHGYPNAVHVEAARTLERELAEAKDAGQRVEDKLEIERTEQDRLRAERDRLQGELRQQIEETFKASQQNAQLISQLAQLTEKNARLRGK